MELIWNMIKQQILIIGHKKGGANLKSNKNIIMSFCFEEFEILYKDIDS